MKLLLIDDEEQVGLSMIENIYKYCQVDEVVFLESYDRFASTFSATQFDAIVSDIRINQELSFKYLDLYQDLIDGTPIIFVSAYDDYALYSIKFRPYEYLLKPLDIHKLSMTLNNIKNKVKSSATIAKDIIGFSTNKGVQFVQVGDIINLRADSNYTIINLVNQKSIIVSKTLGKVEQEINAQKCFIRIGRSDIINILFVKAFKSGRKSKVVMVDGQEIPISSDRKKEIKKLINIV